MLDAWRRWCGKLLSTRALWIAAAILALAAGVYARVVPAWPVVAGGPGGRGTVRRHQVLIRLIVCGIGSRRVGRVGIVLVMLGVAGCMNLRAASSGEIGCAEADIEIRDENTGYGSKTWTAECNGRIYYCSYQATGEESGQYSCTAAVSEGKSASTGTATRNEEGASRVTQGASPGRSSESDPPTEAVGFTLSDSAESAEQSCTANGHSWSATNNAYICSGTPVPVGAEAKARLAFCNDQLCDLTVFVSFGGDDANADDQLNSIVTAMRDKYGSPKENHKGGTAYCRSQGMVRCTAAGGAFLKQSWKWATGEKVFLSFKGKEGKATLAVRYVTGQPIETGASAF